MKAHREGGVETKLHSFFTSELDEDEWSASRSGRFLSEKESYRQPAGSAPAGIRIPDSNNIVVQSLYWLSYPGSNLCKGTGKN